MNKGTADICVVLLEYGYISGGMDHVAKCWPHFDIVRIASNYVVDFTEAVIIGTEFLRFGITKEKW